MFFDLMAYYPAYFASNNSNYSQENYWDNDGTVRPGDDYWGDVNPFYPNVTTYRPVILNHPFTSVADMGYAFRDMPFKSLDFFSGVSADAGLLDLFCLHDTPTPVVAGQVNLNTAESPVQTSLMENAIINTSNSITAINARTMAAYYQSYALNSAATPTANIPLTEAQLPQFLNSYNTLISPVDTKSNLEAPVRALSSVVQTRTWNLLIDVIAQVGKYPGGSTSTSAGDFIVQGEKRYWLSIAIDRYTGQIVDQQLESVNE